jgi:hypothetical protein
VFLSVCEAGIVDASWLWPLVGAMVLLLVDWNGYVELLVQAGKIDATYREFARIARRNCQTASNR